MQLGATAPLYCPALQAEQLDEPSVLNLPLWQFVQIEALALLMVPFVHVLQPLEASWSLYLPGLH